MSKEAKQATKTLDSDGDPAKDAALMRELEAHGQTRLYKCYGKTCISQANGETKCRWSESSTRPTGPPSRPK
jgi:hypothetical protein